MLQWMKDQSRRRRLLLSEQLGLPNSDQLSRVLGTEDERGLDSDRLDKQSSIRSSSLSSSSSSSLNANLDSVDHHTAPSTSKHSNRTANNLGSNDNQSSPIGGTKQQHDAEFLNTSSPGNTSKRPHRNIQNEYPSNEQSASLNKRRAAGRSTEDSTELNALDNTEFEYKGSSAFLKGTQSANPHNDYCQHYVDTGHRPQNFIRDYELNDRFEEYPKLKELIKLKDELIASTATPPMYLKCDLRQPGQLKQLDSKFDVILIDPPLEEYQRTQGVTKTKFWSWDDILHLEIDEIAAPRSFIFLWCGSSDGLDLGRQCLRRWGFRRCEDICWIKTNKNNIGHNKNLEPNAIFQRTKEHCLMGIKGTVRRSTDGDFIHSNVDIDLIISEESPYGTFSKPDEIFHIIEHFCLGKRRLHLFGRDSTIRPGWLTVGPELTNSNFNSDLYKDYFSKNSTDYLTGCTDRIEALRPKSPPHKVAQSNLGSGPHSFRKRY